MGHQHLPERIPTNRGTPASTNEESPSALDSFMERLFGTSGIGNAEAQERLARIPHPQPQRPPPPPDRARPRPRQLRAADRIGI